MSDKNSYLSDPTYQKAKELLGKKKARDINKLNDSKAETGLPGNATEEQKKAFKRGRKHANNQSNI